MDPRERFAILMSNEAPSVVQSLDSSGLDEAANSECEQGLDSYTTPDAWTFALNTEATYDREASDWSVPINATVAQLIRLGKQPISLTMGPRYWADSADNGPEGWGFRFALTFLFPK